jgi:sec-independent protein translocase protein TatB
VFESVGWGEIVVLVVAGLFILGPERLPSAAAWVGRSVRQVKEFANGARDQLRGELGPEFDELRKPLEELRGLRDLHPRNAMRRTLFDDPEPKPNGFAPGPNLTKSNGTPQAHPAAPQPPAPLARNERPPIDPDAT